jgi:hypothetical protein
MNRLAFGFFCALVAVLVWHVFREDRACVRRHGVLVRDASGRFVCLQGRFLARAGGRAGEDHGGRVTPRELDRVQSAARVVLRLHKAPERDDTATYFALWIAARLQGERAIVYFVQRGTDGPVKIGSAEDVGKRVRTLQTGSPERLRLLATVPGGSSLEGLIHERLGAHRIRGEWFRPHAAVLAEAERFAAITTAGKKHPRSWLIA